MSKVLTEQEAGQLAIEALEGDWGLTFEPTIRRIAPDQLNPFPVEDEDDQFRLMFFWREIIHDAAVKVGYQF
jgi:hypothetical protein